MTKWLYLAGAVFFCTGTIASAAYLQGPWWFCWWAVYAVICGCIVWMANTKFKDEIKRLEAEARMRRVNYEASAEAEAIRHGIALQKIQDDRQTELRNRKGLWPPVDRVTCEAPPALPAS